MKKTITILLALVMVLSLAACGGGSTTTNTPAATQSEENAPSATEKPTTPEPEIDMTAQDYAKAVALYEAGDYSAAQAAFESLGGYEDSDEYIKNCGYQLEAAEFLECINTLMPKQGSITIPNVTVDNAAEVERAESLYENLSDEAKEFLGPVYRSEVLLARQWLVNKVQDVIGQAIDLIKEYNMIGAYELLDSVRDIASNSEEQDQVEMIAHCHELIQTACYPNTLIPELPRVSGLPIDDLVTFTQDDYDGYSIFKYYYVNNDRLDAKKKDNNGYDGGLTNLLSETFTIGTLTSDESAYVTRLMEGSSYKKLWLEETNDLVGFVPTYGTSAKTVNGIDFGGQSQYRRHIIETVLIVYGDKELSFLTPKVSVFETTEDEPKSDDGGITSVEGLHSAHANAPSTKGEENALAKAKEYLSIIAFSHDGLIDQLLYEKFSQSEAEFAADNCGADWNEQAAKKAADYLKIFSFSRDGLIDQLEYDKFTHDEAVYGVEQNGF